MSSLSWFAVYCTSEFKAEEGLREAGLEVYCPSLLRWHPVQRTVRVRLALFPGYLFVGLARDGHGDLPVPAVKAVEGVEDILSAGGAPVSIPYDPIDPEFTRLLRGKRDEGEPFSIFALRLQEQCHAFDFTRDRKRAARAVRRAQITFRSFADFGKFLTAEAA